MYLNPWTGQNGEGLNDSVLLSESSESICSPDYTELSKTQIPNIMVLVETEEIVQ